MTSGNDLSYSSECPNVTIFFKIDGRTPLKNAKVSINGTSKKTMMTDGLGKVSYREDNFSEDGTVVVEYENGTKNVEWKAKLPTEEGTYTIPISVWSNNMDGSEW